MSALPRGWVEARLDELGSWQGGGTPDKSNAAYWSAGSIPWVSPKDMKRFHISDAEDQITEAALAGSSANLVAENSVLLVTRSGILKHTLPVAITGRDVAINQDIKAMTPYPGLDPLFIAQQIKSLGPFVLKNCTKAGTTVDSVDFERLKAVPANIPPLAEQKRIVAKLDALNTKSARARTELARIETLVSRYKQAVLSKAFSGELIIPLQAAEAKYARGVKRLFEICESITDGDHQAPPKAVSGVPFITISAMNNGRIDVGKASRYVPQSYYDDLQDSKKPRLGDILYSVTGSYGIPAIVEFDQPFVFQRHIAILRPDTSIASARYLEFLLGSPEVKAQADALATGTAQKTVPLKGLRNFEIPVPTLEVQHEIVRRIESAFAKINRLAGEAGRTLELVGRLDEAILAKAFRGKLVPQDEGDEPAEQLMARIRTERETAPKEKKRIVKRKSTMMTARDFLNAKLPNWPTDGISFQDLRHEFSGSYDDLKDAVFKVLSDEDAVLQQVFDEKRSAMTLRKRKQ